MSVPGSTTGHPLSCAVRCAHARQAAGTRDSRTADDPHDHQRSARGPLADAHGNQRGNERPYCHRGAGPLCRPRRLDLHPATSVEDHRLGHTTGSAGPRSLFRLIRAPGSPPESEDRSASPTSSDPTDPGHQRGRRWAGRVRKAIGDRDGVAAATNRRDASAASIPSVRVGRVRAYSAEVRAGVAWQAGG
jgi:hypothetical protein